MPAWALERELKLRHYPRKRALMAGYPSCRLLFPPPASASGFHVITLAFFVTFVMMNGVGHLQT